MSLPDSYVRQVHADSDQARERFRRLVPLNSDLLLIVLKGHLLVEEQLISLIEVSVENPTALSKARLTFFQELCLANAIAGHIIGQDVYEVIAQLNNIRNTLAHEPEPSKLEELCSRFLAHCAGNPRFASAFELSSNQLKLHTILNHIWAYLAGIRESLKVIKEHSAPPAPDTIRALKIKPSQ